VGLDSVDWNFLVILTLQSDGKYKNFKSRQCGVLTQSLKQFDEILNVEL